MWLIDILVAVAVLVPSVLSTYWEQVDAWLDGVADQLPNMPLDKVSVWSAGQTTAQHRGDHGRG